MTFSEVGGICSKALGLRAARRSGCIQASRDVKKFRVLQCDHLSSNRSFIGTALILGLGSAIGPFAIDMYLPAVQASLTAFFVALGVCQLFYGPLSDIVGRKTPIYFGLAVFGLGSIGCALA